MVEETTLFAAKCEDGYLKFEGESYRVTGMQKASVFSDASEVRNLLSHSAYDFSSLKNLRMVEMRISEYDVE